MFAVRLARAGFRLNIRLWCAFKHATFERVEPLVVFGAVVVLYVCVGLGVAAAGHDTLIFNLIAAVGLPLYGAVCENASRQRRLARR
ncbi:hypothetical protein OHB04_02405 [Streptomyces sp. NBC_01775]|uniref:hypothetical protein n=1 Tax=Streptomyces sp. NBC_01775 TaxID=2975939 RepID=UPI002DD7EC08|nr:hypothetical protein [Streptomyces sp. NBC_01775]WSB74745.1 hypothetical protein OHB04_02405 [Streptomyces sp. NBC_01775]